jgi:Tol biopolymer transport system component
MRTFPLRPLVLLALAAGGCNRDYPNPFADDSQSTPPPASAALLVTSAQWSSTVGAGREIYALNLDGSGLVRLTNCNAGDTPCDTIETASSPDRNRLYVRRAMGTPPLLPGLTYLDLSRSVGSEIITPSVGPTGVDWSPADGVIVYSGRGEAGTDDIFAMDPNGANNRNLTMTATVRERRPRVDPTGTVAVYERIEGITTGKARVYIFQNSTTQIAVTSGGPGTEVLSETPYVVGSDSDPDYSPNGQSIVFRRLTATGNAGLGTWDICTVAVNGSNLTVIVTGAVYRSSPDWGTRGIVFTETDAAAGTSRVVFVQPDGSGRQVLMTQAARFNLGTARWLP